jgi:hypothetical protein
MKNLTAAAILLLTLSGSAFAQQASDIHQQTTAPAGARFEIVQSELAARWTFRLDRFTGRVSQLVTPPLGGHVWDGMIVLDLPPASGTPHAKFQIFTSGIAAKHTFLIDVETGKTWVLESIKTTDKDGNEEEYNEWEPFSS